MGWMGWTRLDRVGQGWTGLDIQLLNKFQVASQKINILTVLSLIFLVKLINNIIINMKYKLLPCIFYVTPINCQPFMEHL